MKHFMQCHSGTRFYPLQPDPAAIYIEDIAHALANVCRFGGHVDEFYSVAQHSVLVSRHCAPENALWGLLHDASEAYIGDMILPLKQHSPEYKNVEHGVMQAVIERFNLYPGKEPADVKLADIRACCTEARDLKGAPEWAIHGPCGMFNENIVPLPPVEARLAFLHRYCELILPKSRAMNLDCVARVTFAGVKMESAPMDLTVTFRSDINEIVSL